MQFYDKSEQVGAHGTDFFHGPSQIRKRFVAALEDAKSLEPRDVWMILIVECVAGGW